MTAKRVIIGIVLIVLGICLLIGILGMNGWELSILNTKQFETNTYEFREEIQDIYISTDTADLTFLPSEDGRCKVVCHEDPKAKHLATLKDGTLSVEITNARKWYDYISLFHFNTPSITVYLPTGTYGHLTIKQSTGHTQLPKDFNFGSIFIQASTGSVDCRSSVSGLLKIETSTGNIHLEALSANAVDVLVTTGKVTLSSLTCEGDITVLVDTGDATLSDIRCLDLCAKGDTGDLFLKNVIATGIFNLERDTGDIRFDGCDASKLSVKTDTGDVTGSLLSEKIFLVQTDTGRIQVPASTTGGKCEIRTDTGDIRISIQ